MRVFWNPVQAGHDPQFFLQRGTVRRNFEVPARATALLDGVAALGLRPEVPPQAPLVSLTAVHAADYLAFLQEAPSAWDALPDHGPEIVPNIHPTPEMLANGAYPGAPIVGRAGWFTADNSTPIAAATWPAARAAADGAVAAADEALAGRHSYALARPPGHHAYAARAGGHCILNNAAIAAARMREGGMARVAVVDIDSHHGNGTQGIFWDRADVPFVSVHGDPDSYYPWYVGRAAERGAGPGAGHNANLPLPQGTGDDAWLAAIEAGLATVGDVQGMVISLGFDPSEHEPLGFLRVTADGFARAATLLARQHLPCAIIQEGGYNTDVLGPLLVRFLGAFGDV